MRTVAINLATAVGQLILSKRDLYGRLRWHLLAAPQAEHCAGSRLDASDTLFWLLDGRGCVVDTWPIFLVTVVSQAAQKK
jgi:hypothetical protein